MIVLGFDPSLTNFGWCLHDTSIPIGTKGRLIESGRIQTSSRTLFIDRYTDIRDNVRNLIDKFGSMYGVSRIGVESPVFHELYSEGMYGVYLFTCEAIRLAKMDVVFFSPGQIKLHAGIYLGRPSGWKMMKPDMVEATKTNAGLRGNLNHNEADAYWAAVAAGRFWNFLDGNLKESELLPQEKKQFTEIHVFKLGVKAGMKLHKGIMFQEDNRFFRWSQEF